jgi:hypothetical protein
MDSGIEKDKFLEQVFRAVTGRPGFFSEGLEWLKGYHRDEVDKRFEAAREASRLEQLEKGKRELERQPDLYEAGARQAADAITCDMQDPVERKKEYDRIYKYRTSPEAFVGLVEFDGQKHLVGYAARAATRAVEGMAQALDGRRDLNAAKAALVFVAMVYGGGKIQGFGELSDILGTPAKDLPDSVTPEYLALAQTAWVKVEGDWEEYKTRPGGLVAGKTQRKGAAESKPESAYRPAVIQRLARACREWAETASDQMERISKGAALGADDEWKAWEPVGSCVPPEFLCDTQYLAQSLLWVSPELSGAVRIASNGLTVWHGDVYRDYEQEGTLREKIAPAAAGLQALANELMSPTPPAWAGGLKSFWDLEFHVGLRRFWSKFPDVSSATIPTADELAVMLNFWNHHLNWPSMYREGGIELREAQIWINIRAKRAIQYLEVAAEGMGLNAICIRHAHEVIVPYASEPIFWSHAVYGNGETFLTKNFPLAVNRLGLEVKEADITVFNAGVLELERLGTRLAAKRGQQVSESDGLLGLDEISLQHAEGAGDSMGTGGGKKPPNFPYEYGSDLHWLWGWGWRIHCLLESDKPINDYCRFIFRPCRQATEAMMRFSVSFPHIIGQIEEAKKFTEAKYAQFLRDQTAVDELADAMEALEHRIIKGAETIHGGKGTTGKDVKPSDSEECVYRKAEYFSKGAGATNGGVKPGTLRQRCAFQKDIRRKRIGGTERKPIWGYCESDVFKVWPYIFGK